MSSAEIDLTCRCKGLMWHAGFNAPCEAEADGEDGLCGPCREAGARCVRPEATCCEDLTREEAHEQFQMLDGQVREVAQAMKEIKEKMDDRATRTRP